MRPASLRVFHPEHAYRQGEHVAAGRSRVSDDGQQALGEATLDTQTFFKSKQAAAVLKHAILSKYIVPFTAKAGFRSDGNRVVIVDGYAGRGRYEDGRPGSPALIAAAAQDTRLRGRSIECFFVEKREAEYTELCSMLTEIEKSSTTPDHLVGPAGGTSRTTSTNCSNGRAVCRSSCSWIRSDSGCPSPSSRACSSAAPAGWAHRRPRSCSGSTPAPSGGSGASCTSRRSSRDATLLALDTAAGGNWWRDEDDPSISNEDYVEWFAKRLLHEITGRANCAGWVVPIKQREDLQPLYLLFFLTRNRAGMETFGETLSTAQAEWRKEVYLDAFRSAQHDGQDALIALDPVKLWEAEEEKLADQWRATIEQNVRALLRERERFVVRTFMSEVYGDTIGVARITHLRKVLLKLHKEGVTSSDSKGKDLMAKEVVRAPGAQLTGEHLLLPPQLGRGHLVEGPAVEQSAADLRCPAAPLLEEERDAAAPQACRRPSIHSGSTGRCFGPDSPPAISQSMPSRSRSSSGPSSGSAEMKRTAAGTSRSSSARHPWSVASMLTPIHTFSGHGRVARAGRGASGAS